MLQDYALKQITKPEEDVSRLADLVVRPLDPNRPEERERFLDITFQAFNIPSAQRQVIAEANKTNYDETLAVFAGQELLAGLLILDKAVYVGQNAIPMGGIAAVACPPEHRRKGATSRLLTESLHRMHSQGQAISMLYPFNYQFYRRYGWELGTVQRHYSIALSDLKEFLPAQGHTRRGTKEDIDAVSALYDQWARAYIGPLRRNRRDWEKQLCPSNPGQEDYRYLYLWYPTADCPQPEGYIVFTISTQSGRRLQVQEFCALSLEAYRGLWGLLANHDSQAERIEISLPEDDPLTYVMANPKVIRCSLEPSAMFRIVDMIPALEGRPFGVASATLGIEISDPLCPWNQGSFLLTIADGQGSVTQTTGEHHSSLALSIETLSQIYTGTISPSQALSLGKAQAKGTIDDLALWDQAFGNLSSHIWDRF